MNNLNQKLKPRSRRLWFCISLTLLAGLSFLAGSKAAGSSNTGPQNPVPPRPSSPPQSKPEAPQTQKGEEAVRLSSRLVLVPVSASDSAGQPIKDLKVDDVVIEEEGKPQQVVALGEPGKTPIDIAMLVDVSGSTRAQFEFEKQAAIQFIRQLLKPGDAVSLFVIGITPRMVKPRTTSGEEAIGGLMSISSSEEPTAFFDTVIEGARYLDTSADTGSRRVMVVISDGEENYSKTGTLPDSLRELQRTDCLFYSLNPTGGGIKLNAVSLKGQSVMEAMASQTGGKAFNLIKTEELESAFRQIAAELQAQYLFGYYADERAGEGFRRITVRSPRRPDLRIRARQGYYSRKTAP